MGAISIFYASVPLRVVLFFFVFFFLRFPLAPLRVAVRLAGAAAAAFCGVLRGRRVIWAPDKGYEQKSS